MEKYGCEKSELVPRVKMYGVNAYLAQYELSFLLVAVQYSVID